MSSVEFKTNSFVTISTNATRFPKLRTIPTDSQVGDSGACATALLCGVKGRFETVGLDDSARYDKCQSSFNSRIPCLADWAQAEGEIGIQY
ncbi:alkaline phosphatase [Caerostris extrusa]|uniref:alkaline phosphatase n=1 Tax=Caerostris extrusa TaxID=172846 RepID=A0AAV4XX31_CAEEX|nr:alkaline phosphatase [Caerostris extrusa]